MAKVLLNAFYLQGQGKLPNAPGYIKSRVSRMVMICFPKWPAAGGSPPRTGSRLRWMESQEKENRQADQTSR